MRQCLDETNLAYHVQHALEEYFDGYYKFHEISAEVYVYMNTWLTFERELDGKPRQGEIRKRIRINLHFAEREEGEDCALQSLGQAGRERIGTASIGNHIERALKDYFKPYETIVEITEDCPSQLPSEVELAYSRGYKTYTVINLYFKLQEDEDRKLSKEVKRL